MLLSITVYEVVVTVVTCVGEIVFLAYNWSIIKTVSKVLIIMGILLWGVADIYGPYVLLILWKKTKKIKEVEMKETQKA